MGHPGSRRARLGIVLLAGFSLVAAACGGSSGSDTATEQTVDENVRGAVQDQLNSDTSEGDSATTAAPASTATNIEELEAEWAADREAIVKKLVDGGYGVDEATKMLKGPDGLEVDLSKCPSDWSETAGLTDTEIKIGQTLAQSGTLADYGNQTKAWDSFEKAVRSQTEAMFETRAQMRAGAQNPDAHITFMEQRLEGMKAVQKARTDLYKVLTPEQKAIADRYGFQGPRS